MSPPVFGSSESRKSIYLDLEYERKKSNEVYGESDLISRSNSFAGRAHSAQAAKHFREHNEATLTRIGEILKSRGASSDQLTELHSLGGILQPQAFYEGLLDLAYHWNSQSQSTQAEPLLLVLSGEAPESITGGDSIPSEIQAKAKRIRKTGFLNYGTESWGVSAEKFLRSMSGDRASNGLLQTASWVGLAAIACHYVRPLRPFAAAGIGLLSEPRIAAGILLASGRQLYLQAPLAKSAASRLFGFSDSAGYSQWEDALTVLGFSVGTVGIAVGTSSFLLGGRSGWRYGSKVMQEGGSFAEARRAGFVYGDTTRRAVMDPQVWGNYARGAVGLSPFQRGALNFFSRASEEILVKGSILYAGGRLLIGIDARQRQGENGPSLPGLVFDFAGQVFPAVTLHLYRRGRGDSRSNLGPAMSQDFMDRHYNDAALREVTLGRAERGLPPITSLQREIFGNRARREFTQMGELLENAKSLTPLPKTSTTNRDFYLSMKPRITPQDTFQPFRFSEAVSAPKDFAAVRHSVSQMDLEALRRAYRDGQLSPVGVLQSLFDHPDVAQGAIFPRKLTSGPLHRHLMNLAKQSQARWELGTPRPLEGVLVAVKDLFPGSDGVMMGGSKTGLLRGIEPSPVVQSLLELGAIPIPVGMVAAANGGSGLFSGFGYVPHPTREGFDPAGSSNATAYTVAKPDIPIMLGIGTDTGGSVTAPAGAVGVFSFVPPSGLISTKNMIPFATFLDRVGVMSQQPKDGMYLAKLLAKQIGNDPHAKADNPGELFTPSSFRPRMVYSPALVAEMEASFPGAGQAFMKQVEGYQQRGHEVVALQDDAWKFSYDIPLINYPWDAYAANLFTHTNALKNGSFEPPRRTLDENNLTRYPLGQFALEKGYFDRARANSSEYLRLMREKLGPGVVMLTPSPQAVPTAKLLAGSAGAMLDLHDKITMNKNRIPEWGQINLPDSDRAFGITLSGELPDLVHLMEESQLTRYRPAPGPVRRALPQIMTPPPETESLPPPKFSEPPPAPVWADIAAN